MGSSHNVFIGTYLAIKETTTQTTVDLCANHDRGTGKHCSACGRSEANRYDDTHHRPSDTFFEECQDRLVEVLGDEGGCLTVSNFGKGGLGLTSWDDDQALDIPDRAKCEAEFLVKHQADLDRLRELGCEVTIEFGVVSWTR